MVHFPDGPTHTLSNSAFKGSRLEWLQQTISRCPAHSATQPPGLLATGHELTFPNALDLCLSRSKTVRPTTSSRSHLNTFEDQHWWFTLLPTAILHRNKTHRGDPDWFRQATHPCFFLVVNDFKIGQSSSFGDRSVRRIGLASDRLRHIPMEE